MEHGSFCSKADGALFEDAGKIPVQGMIVVNWRSLYTTHQRLEEFGFAVGGERGARMRPAPYVNTSYLTAPSETRCNSQSSIESFRLPDFVARLYR
jgi:hypothetical protein